MITRISQHHVIPLNISTAFRNLLYRIVDCTCLLCKRTVRKLPEILNKKEKLDHLYSYARKIIQSCPDGSPMGFEILKLKGHVCYKLDQLVTMHGSLLNNSY